MPPDPGIQAADPLGDAHATLTRILGAIEEYVYTVEFLPGDGYEVVFAGPCREQFLGLAVHEAASVVWRHHVHPDDVAVFDEAHAGARESGWLDVQYRMVGADGAVRWVRDRGRMRTEHGRRFLDGSVVDASAIRRTQGQLEEARREADRLAHVDPLTGSANRRMLPWLLSFHEARTGLAILSIDLDRFKQVNDLFGHAGGDAVLVAVAERLMDRLRGSDALVRMGGEEFLVVAYGVRDEAALLELAEGLRVVVEEAPVAAAGHDLPVTISIGAVLVTPGLDADTALSSADGALYAAKHRGRNRVQLATVEDPADDDLRTDDGEAMRAARAMAVAARARTGARSDHLEAVSLLAARVARRLGLGGPDILRCRVAGLVHDIGSAAVPGDELVAAVPELSSLAAIVRHRTEHHDGSGAPGGLAGDAIPLESRILAAAAAWEALGPEADPAALDALSGTQLDPDVVAALHSVLERRRDADAG